MIGCDLPPIVNGYVLCDVRGCKGSTDGGEDGRYPSWPAVALPVTLASK